MNCSGVKVLLLRRAGCQENSQRAARQPRNGQDEQQVVPAESLHQAEGESRLGGVDLVHRNQLLAAGLLPSPIWMAISVRRALVALLNSSAVIARIFLGSVVRLILLVIS